MTIKLKEILNDYIEKTLGIPRVMEEYKIANAWQKVNPAKIAENALPEKLVGGVLFLNVKNSAWAQQISLMKTDIALRLNEELGGRVVSDIRTRTGFIEKVDGDQKKEIKENKCPSCGASHYGIEISCAICSREKKQADISALYRMANREPRLTLLEAKKEFPGTTDLDFRRVKRELSALKRETERNIGKKGG